MPYHGPSVRDVPSPPTSLIAKLSRIMSEVGYIEKRGRNEFHKYDYATEADVTAGVRDSFIKHGVMLIPEILTTKREPLEGKNALTQVVMLIHLYDTETGQSLNVAWSGDGMDSGDKGIYKALTGGIKYFLMKTLLIPTGDDPEKDNKGEQDQAKARLQPAKAPVRSVEGQRDPRIISDKQGKRLFAIASQAGMDDVALKELVASHGFESRRDITKAKYEDICTAAEAFGAQAPAQSEEPPPDYSDMPEAE